MIISALTYSHLVGKYVRMSRLSTPEELRATGEQIVGMEGLIVGVEDDQDVVLVRVDYGEVWPITGYDAPDWHFQIWMSEDACARSRGRLSREVS